MCYRADRASGASRARCSMSCNQAGALAKSSKLQHMARGGDALPKGQYAITLPAIEDLVSVHLRTYFDIKIRGWGAEI